MNAGASSALVSQDGSGQNATHDLSAGRVFKRVSFSVECRIKADISAVSFQHNLAKSGCVSRHGGFRGPTARRSQPRALERSDKPWDF